MWLPSAKISKTNCPRPALAKPDQLTLTRTTISSQTLFKLVKRSKLEGLSVIQRANSIFLADRSLTPDNLEYIFYQVLCSELSPTAASRRFIQMYEKDLGVYDSGSIGNV